MKEYVESSLSKLGLEMFTVTIENGDDVNISVKGYSKVFEIKNFSLYTDREKYLMMTTTYNSILCHIHEKTCSKDMILNLVGLGLLLVASYYFIIYYIL